MLKTAVCGYNNPDYDCGGAGRGGDDIDCVDRQMKTRMMMMIKIIDGDEEEEDDNDGDDYD